MYSFKYHLVTICAVFLALAVGLLLGAAIGGSGLLSTTTSELVDSLSERFSYLDSENSALSMENSVYSSLTDVLIDEWDDGMLEERDILVLSGSSSEQTAMAQEISDYVTAAGGRCAVVQVNADSFGLEDESVLEVLQQVLPEVEGREYSTVVVEALVEEWTRGAQEADVFDGGRIASDSSPSDADRESYPVTCALVDSGAVAIGGTSSIPDSIDCVVDTLLVDSGSVDDSGDAVYMVDPVGLELATQMHAAGVVAVLTQYSDHSQPLMDAASSMDLAGVSSYSGNIARYSIVYLLATGQSGVYGTDSDSSHWYPTG